MSDPVDAEAEEGWIDHEVAAEFPGLRLHTKTVAARLGRSPRALKMQLRMLSDRFYGAQAITMRDSPIPHAYRVFFRGVGMDPDTTRTPIEAAALERLWHGGFRSRNLVHDSLLIALVETGVPIWALDDAPLDGPLGIRLAQEGERLGTGELAPDLVPGRLVVADAARTVAELFGEIAEDYALTSATRRLRLFSVQVAGVPSIHVEEAMWLCSSALASS